MVENLMLFILASGFSLLLAFVIMLHASDIFLTKEESRQFEDAFWCDGEMPPRAKKIMRMIFILALLPGVFYFGYGLLFL